jgi:hypothetical protein
VDGHKITMMAEDLTAVQAYLDHIRARGKPLRRLIEHAFHRPEISGDFYGTADNVDIFPDVIYVDDYKHGIGVVVEPERNPQLLQYAAGVLLSLAEENTGWADIPDRLTLTIAQPRAPHPRPIRSWETTRSEVLRWLTEEWMPAAEATLPPGAPLHSGDHCRFCPLNKGVQCPEMQAAVARVLSYKDRDMAALEDWELSALKADCEVAKMVEKSVGDEIFARLSRGQAISGWKLADKRADRVWKPEAEPALLEALGDKAWQPRVLVSPAQAEKIPGGGEVVKLHAFKPQTGLTLAKVSDAREGRTMRAAKEAFADLLDPALNLMRE